MIFAPVRCFVQFCDEPRPPGQFGRHVRPMIRSAMRLFTAAAFISVLAALMLATPAQGAGPAAPRPRSALGMAYDAAGGQVVLFGGTEDLNLLGDTWTWDGTEWTKRNPVRSPHKREFYGMAYDAARSQVVLFGGVHSNYLGDTWTWDGTDWTERTPAHSPPSRVSPGMAYDAARRQIVLFGGLNHTGYLADTWTWDGTDWTRRTTAHAPSARFGHTMADDATHGKVVLFGGLNASGYLGDTWTWDGTDWTKRTPSDSPSNRCCVGMADDAALGQIAMFGGIGGHRRKSFGDTWTWDGTDWTERAARQSPNKRAAMGVAYDAAHGQVVVFGGGGTSGLLGDTWTWDGADWVQRPAVSINLGPRSGPPGTTVQVDAWGFRAGEPVRLTFVDSTQGRTFLRKVKTDVTGAFTIQVTIPLTATPGRQHLKAKGPAGAEVATRSFTVQLRSRAGGRNSPNGRTVSDPSRR
jgi:hypothetical protein